MVFGETEVESVIYEILLDCRSVIPPLDRNEIARHAVDHFSLAIHKQVYAALERLAQRGLVSDDRETTKGKPIRYWLPTPCNPSH